MKHYFNKRLCGRVNKKISRAPRSVFAYRPGRSACRREALVRAGASHFPSENGGLFAGLAVCDPTAVDISRRILYTHAVGPAVVCLSETVCGQKDGCSDLPAYGQGREGRVCCS